MYCDLWKFLISVMGPLHYWLGFANKLIANDHWNTVMEDLETYDWPKVMGKGKEFSDYVLERQGED